MSRCPFGGAGFFMLFFNSFSTCVDAGLLAARVDVLLSMFCFWFRWSVGQWRPAALYSSISLHNCSGDGVGVR